MATLGDEEDAKYVRARWGWVLAVVFFVVPLIVAPIALARISPGTDCCMGRGATVAMTMLFWSLVTGLVLFWPAVNIVRNGDGGKLTRPHMWTLIGIAIAAFVVFPFFVGNLLEGNL